MRARLHVFGPGDALQGLSRASSEGFVECDGKRGRVRPHWPAPARTGPHRPAPARTGPHRPAPARTGPRRLVPWSGCGGSEWEHWSHTLNRRAQKIAQATMRDRDGVLGLSESADPRTQQNPTQNAQMR
ncbi:unnamed protein product [Lota lota]